MKEKYLPAGRQDANPEMILVRFWENRAETIT